MWSQELSVETLFGSRALVYSGYWIPYWVWLKATGGFIQGWVAVQIVLSALTCVLIYETVRRLMDNAAGIVAGGVFVVQSQVFFWAVRPQSEMMLTFVFAVAMWRLVEYHLHPTTRNRVLTLVALGFVATVRPNGLAIVFGYLVWDFFPSSSDRRLDLFFSSKVNLALAGGVVSLIAYRLYFGWSRGSVLFPWKDGVIITYSNFAYEYTPVAADSILEFFVLNIHHVVVIALLRAIWFFSPFMPQWQPVHIAFSLLTLAPLVVGAFLGIRTAFSTNRRLLVLWGTPLAMIVLTAMGTWVAGWRNFLGPAAVVYALFTGYYVHEHDPLSIRSRLDRLAPS